MTQTPEQLRQSAARIRQMAQYADGPAFHEEMQRAEHLEAEAKALEESAAPTNPAPKNEPPRTGNRSCVSGTPVVHDRRTGKSSCVSGTPVVHDRRRKDLAKIHLLKKQAGLDDDSYRDLLQQLTGQRSSSKLKSWERGKVITYLKKTLGQAGQYTHPGRPNSIDSKPQLQKIEALLAEAKRPWAYAHKIAEQMHGKKRLDWCDSNELSGVIAALIKDAQKHGRRVN